ncbi:hypothetical protein FB451DRAFT_1170094 [Mycena latifolia]|nr:hypothetical protein FB451DRAFT_1170094 [Mycena latifolia]
MLYAGTSMYRLQNRKQNEGGSVLVFRSDQEKKIAGRANGVFRHWISDHEQYAGDQRWRDGERDTRHCNISLRLKKWGTCLVGANSDENRLEEKVDLEFDVIRVQPDADLIFLGGAMWRGILPTPFEMGKNVRGSLSLAKTYIKNVDANKLEIGDMTGDDDRSFSILTPESKRAIWRKRGPTGRRTPNEHDASRERLAVNAKSLHLTRVRDGRRRHIPARGRSAPKTNSKRSVAEKERSVRVGEDDLGEMKQRTEENWPWDRDINGRISICHGSTSTVFDTVMSRFEKNLIMESWPWVTQSESMNFSVSRPGAQLRREGEGVLNSPVPGDRGILNVEYQGTRISADNDEINREEEERTVEISRRAIYYYKQSETQKKAERRENAEGEVPSHRVIAILGSNHFVSEWSRGAQEGE